MKKNIINTLIFFPKQTITIVLFIITITNCSKTAATETAAANNTNPTATTSTTTVNVKFSDDYLASPHYTGLTEIEKNILKKLPNAIFQEINKQRALLDSFWWGMDMVKNWVQNGNSGTTVPIFPNKTDREQYQPRSMYAAKPYQYGQNNNRARAVKTHDMLNQCAQEYAEDMAFSDVFDHNAPSRKANNAKQEPQDRVLRSNFYKAPDLISDQTYRYKMTFKEVNNVTINEKFIDSFTIAKELTTPLLGADLSESIQFQQGTNFYPLGWGEKTEDEIVAELARIHVLNWANSKTGHRENQYSMVRVYIGVGVAFRVAGSLKTIYSCLKCF